MSRINFLIETFILLIVIAEITFVPFLLAESKVVETTGYGGEKRGALRDAFRSAIEIGLGVEIRAETEVERFRLVKDVIFTKSQGYVESYELLSENPNSPMGYEITIKAMVTKGKVTELDNLRTMIELMGNPAIMVHITPAMAGHPAGVELISKQITIALESAGYNMIAAPRRGKNRIEDALDIAGDLDADVVILGQVHSDITGHHGSSQFPLVTSRSQFTGEVVVVETGEIVYTVESSEGQGTANTEEASIKKAIHTYMEEISDTLLWNMAPRIGPPYTIELSVSGIECSATNDVKDKVFSSVDVEQVDLKRCRDNTGLFKVRIVCPTLEFASSLTDLLGPRASVTAIGRGRVDVTY